MRLPFPATLTAYIVTSTLVLTTPRLASADNPIAGCNFLTHGAACARDGSNACSGVCLPTWSDAGAADAGITMECFPADTPIVAISGYQVPGIEGFACAPAGAPGSDCAHSCRSGECVAMPAVSGTECTPDGGSNVCAGQCDGQGGCTTDPALQENPYGTQEGCLFLACNPLDVTKESGEFAAPTGLACAGGEDPCQTNTHCTALGSCTGEMIPGCVEPAPDGGSGASREAGGSTTKDDGGTTTSDESGAPKDASALHSSRDAGPDAGHAKLEGGETADSSSGGCSASPRSSGQRYGWGLLVALGLVGARRRKPGHR